MGILINPITGNLDFTGSGGGGGGPVSQTPNYVHSFTSANFTGPGGGFYTLSLAAATHGKGTNPVVQIYETNGANFEQVFAFCQIDGSGNITMKVTASPDSRFSGKLIVSENN